MDANGVDKAVILQGHLNGYQNYYTHLAIKRYPERFTGAFSVDPFADNAMQIVKRHVEVLGFRAIKFEISQGGVSMDTVDKKRLSVLIQTHM